MSYQAISQGGMNLYIPNHISLLRVPPTEMHMVTSVNVIFVGFFVRSVGYNSYEHFLM